MNHLKRLILQTAVVTLGACGVRQDEPAFTVTNEPVVDLKNETIDPTDRYQKPETANLPQSSFDQSVSETTGMRQESPDAQGKLKNSQASAGEDPSQANRSGAASEELNPPPQNQHIDSHTTPEGHTSHGEPKDMSSVGAVITSSSEGGSTAGGSTVGGAVVSGSPVQQVPSFAQTVTEVADLCAAKPQQKVTQLLEFNAQKNNCTWFPSGFEGQNYMQGVTGQEPRVKPTLPEGAVLCSVALSSGTQGNNSWVYDDEFYFTLNRKVLVSSHKNSLSRFSTSNEFYDYDFNKLIGMRYQGDKGGGIYCFGFDPLNNSNSCSFPATETLAPVSYLVNQNQATKIGALVKTQQKLDFELFVTGDNDPTIDCRHSGLKFELSLFYVKK